MSCNLKLTLYGTMEFFEDLGSWLQEYGMYLQDPEDAHQNVRYCNPHKLSFDPRSSLTVQDICQKSVGSLMTVHNLEERSSFMELLDGHLELEEALQPELIRTSLKR